MDANVSHQKELFVSNTLGTTPTEVFLVASTPILACMLYALVKTHFGLQRTGSWYKNLKLLLFESGILVVLPFFTVTLLSDFVLYLNIVLLIAIFLMIYVNTPIVYRFDEFAREVKQCIPMEQYYLTNYKAQIQICTAICIMAVDFDIFPRRFAKVEVYGVGVMDMAVGSLIFSSALTSMQTRLASQITFSHVLKNLKGSLVLVFLGMLRVLLVKSSNYQEHVTEYGVHWNFFFTLALVKPLCTFILFVLPWLQKQPYYLLLSLCIILMYQVSLSKYGLTEVIQNGFHGDQSRTSFLDANREGIFSCIGTLSLYFSGLFFGKQLFKDKLGLLNKMSWLLLWSASAWTAMHISIIYIVPISRQMSNLSYYLLQISCNTFLLLGYMFIDLIMESVTAMNKKKKDDKQKVQYGSLSFLCRAINRNLLFYFLLANICTGIVNFVVDTLHSTVAFSVCLNLVYLFLIDFVIWVVYMFQL